MFSLTISFISSGCLDEETLKSVGFTSTQDLEVIDSPEICTDLFSTSGTCVPEATVKAKIEADNNNFRSSVTVFANVSSALTNLASIVGSESEENKEAIEKMEENTKNTRDSCIKAWNVVQQGITCYLACGDASENTSVGAKVTVKVNRDNVGEALEACKDYIDSMCLLTAGVSISSSVTVSDNLFLSKQAEYKSSCEVLKENYSCDTEECKKTTRDTIINVFFKPYNYSFFTSANVFADVSFDNELENKEVEDKEVEDKEIEDKNQEDLLNNSSYRRLEEESDVDAESDPDGTDTKTHGEKSNVEKVESSSSLISVIITGLMMLLIAN